jgi:hypothetical protein
MAHRTWGVGRAVTLSTELHAWPINRPHLSAAWTDHDRAELSLSWGNGNSDPVFSFAISFTVPAWIERRLP